MADKKISALTGATTPLAGTEVLPIVQSGATVKVAVSDLTAGRAVSALSATLSSLTSDRVPYATTSGLLTDSSNLQFDGTNLNALGSLRVGTTSTIVSGKQTTSFDGNALNGLILSESANATSSTFIGFANASTIIGSVARVGATSAVIYNTSSDYRLKNIIGPVANAGQRIDALQPVEYTWKEDGTQARGFLAHEFQEVYASSVTGVKDAVDADGNPVYQAMQASTSELIADLVAEIQSLRQRLAALEAK
jgi:hypothetical protein